MAMVDHLWRHRWSGGPSMEAILGPGDHPQQHNNNYYYFAADGQGDGPILGGPSVA